MTSPGRTISSSTRRAPRACRTGCSRRAWRLEPRGSRNPIVALGREGRAELALAGGVPDEASGIFRDKSPDGFQRAGAVIRAHRMAVDHRVLDDEVVARPQTGNP